MRVAYQDCGCIALPDEIVAAMNLSAGTILDIFYDSRSKTARIALADAEGNPEVAASASCRIRTNTK